MNNDKSNITIGLPKPNGSVFWAPSGTALPTNAAATLATGYINLGYITEDGVTETVAEDGDDISAWGPELVMHSQTGYAKTLTFSLMESARASALQFIYGVDNVTIGEDGSFTVKETSDALPRGVLVVDTISNNGDKPRKRRQIFADAQFTDRSGDHVFNNSDVLVYPVTMTSYKATDGSFKTEYLSAAV